MAGIVGTLLKDDAVAHAFHDRMLRRLKHRGHAKTSKSKNPQGTVVVSQLGGEGPRSDSTDKDACILAIDNGNLRLTTQMESRILEGIFRIDSSGLEGITVAGTVGGGVRVLRSIDGIRPIYYAPLEQGFAFASERKAIWALPSSFVRPIEPGEAVTFFWNGTSQSQQCDVRRRPLVDETASEAHFITALRSRLEESFSRLMSTERCAVLFSGGVDSALAALMTAKSCKKVSLITCASGAAKDARMAENAAEQLDLEHHFVHLNSDEVWKALPEVIYAIESTNRMDVEIAIPFFVAAGEAKRRKCRIVVSGQGPDELFAGYAKHEMILAEKGPEALKEQLWSELSVTHEANIARDERAIAAQGLTGFFPYLYTGFVKTAFAVPAEKMVRLEGSKKRKLIFRELAKSIGLPIRLCGTKKAATQYSSGSAKVLIQSIRANVEEAKRVTKKKAETLVQEVLDFIGNEVGVPPQYGFIGELNLDLGPTMKLLKKIE